MAKVRIDKLVDGNVVLHTHGIDDVDSTVTDSFYRRIPTPIIGTDTTMGALWVVTEDNGYGVNDLSNKTLHNVYLGSHASDTNSPVRGGALRYRDSGSTDFFEMYRKYTSTWELAYFLTEIEKSDLLKFTELSEASLEVDAYGVPSLNRFAVSMGAFNVYTLVDGGSF
jgi:hypothetical protein